MTASQASQAVAGAWGWEAWLWLAVPLGVYCAVTLGLFAFGRSEEPGLRNFFFGHVSDSLRRLTGYPGWSMAGVLSGLLFLLVLVIGFYWDVAWHVDHGRDKQVLTPAHTMILVGLGGLVYSAYLTMLFATLDQSRAGFRYGIARVPWSSLLLLVLGIGGVAAFPIDNLWHQAYGVDVTLWSPPHLQLIAGGGLGTVALFLMCAEARPEARPTPLGRAIVVLTGGTVLVALSAVQAEFDYGVPQFQALYLPLLIAVAAALALTLARVALGPWGAVKVALVYLVLRSMVALVVGGALGHTVPRFPVYLPSALAVEAAAVAVGTRARLRLGLAAGALVGTLGLAGELAWVRLSGWSTAAMPASLLAQVAVLAPVAAVAAAVLGAGLACAFVGVTGDRDGDRPVPLAALAGAGMALVAVLAYPLPRNVGEVEAVVRTAVVGGGEAAVEVELEPPDAAESATAFGVTSWQGGGRVTAGFDEVGPGRYRAERTVPVTGDWKTIVSLQRGDQVMAAPVYLPADPTIGAEAVPLVAQRRTPFVRNTDLLLREQHPGPAWPALAAWSGLVAMLALVVGLMAVTARRVRVGGEPETGRPIQGPIGARAR